MEFPAYRPRRLRRNETLRRMVRETRLSVDQLILPLFVVPGSGVVNPVGSMPGVAQLSVDKTVEECRAVRDLGIPAVVGCGDATHQLPEGEQVTVSCAEGDTGYVYRGLLDVEVKRSQVEASCDLAVTLLRDLYRERAHVAHAPELVAGDERLSLP